MNDLLPDSRAKNTRGRIFQGGTTWIPVFCANCGKEGPIVTENVTFAFWLCTPWEKKNGPITAMMRVPDQVFYERMLHEQLEYAGRPMTGAELSQVGEHTALAKLIKEAK